MATIQTASFLLALGGDIGNTVPKFDVPVSEIAVLQAIHGADAITDLSPGGEIETSNGEELSRLRGIYNRAQDGNSGLVIDGVYPGRGAQVVRTIEDLGLSEVQFKVERARAAEAKKAARKPRATKAAEPDAEPAVDDGENADAAFLD